MNQNLHNLGLGDDVFALDWGTVAGQVEVHGIRGNDIIALAHLKAQQVAIRAGRGDDGVRLAKVQASRIGVGLGSRERSDASRRYDQLELPNSTEAMKQTRLNSKS